jgi:hypothetical protein
LLRVGGFAADDWRPCDDWEFLAKVVLSGLRLEVVAKSLAWYRVDNVASFEGANGNGDGDEIHRLRPYLQAMPPAFRDLLKMSLTLSRQGRRAATEPPTTPSNGHDPSLLSEEELLRIVRERLARGGNRRIAAFLKEWMDYNAARVNLPKLRLERLPYVVRELFKGNYHRFGHGFGSALRDLRRAPKLPGPSLDQ